MEELSSDKEMRRGTDNSFVEECFRRKEKGQTSSIEVVRLRDLKHEGCTSSKEGIGEGFGEGHIESEPIAG